METPPVPRKRARPFAHSKLTATDVLEIRASDDSATALGKKYNVTSQNIGAIRAGKSWRHLLPTPEATS